MVAIFPLPLRAQPEGEKVIFRKPLSDGRELVMVLEPIVPASALKDLIPPRVLVRMLGYTSLNLMLHSPSNPPLRLWSVRYAIYRQSECDEIQVLDLLVKPDMIVVALAGPGSSIGLVKIGFGTGEGFVDLPAADWSLLAAAIPATPGRLSAKIAFDENAKRVTVEVTDFLQDTKQHTSFTQANREWRFVRVKQWEEKVPATQPTTKDTVHN
jgi:hypothetical protein